MFSLNYKCNNESLKHHFKELHFITPIENVASILEKGILCHKLAETIKHEDISNPSVQKNRSYKYIPNNSREKYNKKQLILHEYVNLYFNAHNGMMLALKLKKKQLCVLSIDIAVLRKPEAIVSNVNAALNIAQFQSAKKACFSREVMRALKNPFYAYRSQSYSYRTIWKAARQAEALVPKKVASKWIKAIYVPNEKVGEKLSKNLTKDIPIWVHETLFFQKGPLGQLTEAKKDVSIQAQHTAIFGERRASEAKPDFFE
ncbi:DarT ssDNA thymidine ADP-ribosyltransferase family protein [Candidatus Neptunochlamydia vexilliferae]|uniref:DarT domain-containing protein n=1 Tax=Candidatus Neptunichlamydia vexilliferae TaxID=1651774 RepID=A0ABS0AZJ6_9BACT|nr:DarT ssDNA thymidine ADP-ribosyltransferase family protein [Candidatus Neptunochlamydia vexilliferae]MBF5059032.1 hypothetical protein [Candidatus Neptunochlamydia vexilliferae]